MSHVSPPNSRISHQKFLYPPTLAIEDDYSAFPFVLFIFSIQPNFRLDQGEIPRAVLLASNRKRKYLTQCKKDADKKKPPKSGIKKIFLQNGARRMAFGKIEKKIRGRKREKWRNY